MICSFGMLKDSAINYAINKTKLTISLKIGEAGLVSTIRVVMYSFKLMLMIGDSIIFSKNKD
jgi:hypothetical protein